MASLKILTLLTAMLCLSCSGIIIKPNFDIRDKDDIKARVAIKEDKFRKQKTIKGPPIAIGDILGTYKTWFLRAIKNENIPPSVHVYISFMYSNNDWLLFDEAASNGEIFETKVINRDVRSCRSTGGCSYNEDLIFYIPIEKLESLLNEDGVVHFGIRNKFGENWVIDFTREYIDAFSSFL